MFLFGKMYRTDPALKIYGTHFCFVFAEQQKHCADPMQIPKDES